MSHVDSPADPVPPSKSWRLPNCPFQIDCSPAVLSQICREVERARSAQQGERETGGVLFGIHQSDRIRILACRPLQSEHAMGPGFVLSPRDEKRLTQLVASAGTDEQLRGLEALGWYHSHIRSHIFLSGRDLQIHSRYFPAPHHVALVVHPSTETPTRAGFFFRDASGQMRTESSYEEFTIEEPPPEAEVKKSAPSKAPRASRPDTPSPEPDPPQREAVCPRCGSRHIRRSRRAGGYDKLRDIFGYFPYRCHECLSRAYVRTSPGMADSHPRPRKRPEERRRIKLRRRREVLLWGGGLIGFLAILYYVIRDTGPKADQP